jgi:hypothetical protein
MWAPSHSYSSLTLNYEQLDEGFYNEAIKKPLACPKCGMEIKRLPELMAHLEEVHP